MLVGLMAVAVPLTCLAQSDTLASEEEDLAFVEVKPVFPGGEAELYKYLQKTIQYPGEALNRGIEGKVWVQFTIDKEGNVTKAKVVRGVEASLNSEALRAIRSMPKWTPGYQAGKPVPVRYTMPINFTLRSGKGKKKK